MNNVGSIRGKANDVSSVEECLNLFFDDSMFHLLLNKTNRRINECLDVLRKHREHTFESSKYTWLRETSLNEVRALVGLMYFRGLYGMNHHSIEILFSKKAGTTSVQCHYVERTHEIFVELHYV